MTDPVDERARLGSDPTVALTSSDGSEAPSPSGAPRPGSGVVLAATDARGLTGERYERRALLGEGGMGEVRLCRDYRIGREVAMKVVRPGAREGAEERFLYEARIQGRLEHPSVVPVYDLAEGEGGAAYFTMKRVRGHELDAILAHLRGGDAEMAAQFPRRKLLGALASACLAVEFAHQRGVLHRDLKPANLMLGDFGEVYVLDWGLAKQKGDAEPPPGSFGVDALGSGGSQPRTELGQILGTPGYMAPEQVERPSEIDERADVYALGAVLYEVLALEPLHPGKDTASRVRGTLAGGHAPPSARAPTLGIAPELDALVMRATALAPADRFPSARALHDALEAFLGGDRDLALRRELSQKHTKAALAQLDGGHLGVDAAATRRRAMRELGNALALDPENANAIRALFTLLTEPPREVPPEVTAELEAVRHEQLRLGGRVGATVFLAVDAMFVFILWMGVKSWPGALSILGTSIAAATASYAVSRIARPRPWAVLPVVALAVAFAGSLAWMFGPFVVTPSVAAVFTLIFSMANPKELRPAIIVLGLLAVLVPAGLEWAGLVSPSIAFEGGTITLLPRAASFPKVATTVFLVVTNLCVLVMSGAAMAPMRKQLDAAQLRARLMAWNLRQLVPDEVHHAPDAAKPPASPQSTDASKP